MTSANRLCLFRLSKLIPSGLHNQRNLIQGTLPQLLMLFVIKSVIESPEWSFSCSVWALVALSLHMTAGKFAYFIEWFWDWFCRYITNLLRFSAELAVLWSLSLTTFPIKIIPARENVTHILSTTSKHSIRFPMTNITLKSFQCVR
jgi:hypothetical protein